MQFDVFDFPKLEETCKLHSASPTKKRIFGQISLIPYVCNSWVRLSLKVARTTCIEITLLTWKRCLRDSNQIRFVHNKHKPFRCDSCGISFGFRDGLQRHLTMVHEQVRPYACENCPLKFKTRAHLSKHLLAIHPERYRHDGSSSKSKTKGTWSSFEPPFYNTGKIVRK